MIGMINEKRPKVPPPIAINCKKQTIITIIKVIFDLFLPNINESIKATKAEGCKIDPKITPKK